MRRRLAAALACVALAFAAAFPPAASAQEERVYDQRNHRENILTAIQTWIAILQRIVQIANQVQDLLALEDPAFREIQDLLAELAQILRATEGLVYPLEDLDPRFRDLFPGFEPADDLPESYAESVAKDYVMAELDGRTIEEALADGEPAKKVWQAVVATFDVPSTLR